MRRFKRLLPVICVTCAIILLSLIIYQKMMQYEKDECWRLLENSAQSVSEEISVKLQDEITKMSLMGKIASEGDDLEKQIRFLHLDLAQPTTIFSRIDVLYPDGTLLSNGTTRTVQKEIDFDAAAARGAHMSARMVDDMTGTDCIYYVLPIERNQTCCALMVGLIESKRLAEIFAPKIYDGQANCILLDASDGNIIMDSWHETMGNAYSSELQDRKRVRGYEDIDMEQELRERKTGVIAFESRTTQNNMYLYYMPVDLFDWELQIFVQEEVAFENLFHFRKLLMGAGVVEALLLLIYFLWNFRTVSQLEKSHLEIAQQKEKLHHLSYTDLLTHVYNRNKYIELLDDCKGKTLSNVGVIYLDLNGLKEINDTQSHKAGDQYICKAARVFSKSFPDSCYRIGGDEFVIVALEIQQEYFVDCMERLEHLIQKDNINVSLGFLWKEECKDLDALLKDTERLMYKEKNNYYLTHKKWR